jgi:ubiquinone biosynthesis protein Coq4
MALPAKSLGHRYATWFENASGKPLPDPVLAPGTDGDDTWLQQQVRRTHHEWPVVSGCPPSPAGASGTALAQRRLARAVPLVLGKPPTMVGLQLSRTVRASNLVEGASPRPHTRIRLGAQASSVVSTRTRRRW